MLLTVSVPIFPYMFYTYIIQSEKDGSYYTGYSSDLDDRLLRHNTGKSRYTSKRMPWVLVYSEVFTTKTEAIKRERFLKRQKSREFYERMIASK
ncbi:GIY-YIG nuclease family protein [Sungkyunkwania multivorans]|uniref:GIY-YIG nuclease family protein n=1 Tax=Sungkyunkwania multivorans TaxID=1173618 RepID=A0ABW3D5I2_9FLAO